MKPTPETTWAVCSNLDSPHRLDAGDAVAVDDFWERVQPGDEMPVGQCPECDCLAYLEKPAGESTAVCVVEGGILTACVGPTSYVVLDYDELPDDADDALVSAQELLTIPGLSDEQVAAIREFIGHAQQRAAQGGGR